MDYIGIGFNPLRTGADFIYALLNRQFLDGNQAPEVKIKIDESSSIVGIDAFYFSATFNDCRYYNSYAGGGGIYQLISDFIDYTDQKNIALFLATVPMEDSEKVFYHRWKLGRQLIEIPDSPEEAVCVREINHSLLSLCKPEKNCYLTRLDVIVDQINHTGGFPMQPLTGDTPGNDGLVVRDPRHLRREGLNITHEGSRILYESINRQIETATHKPRCPRP